jgi:hypothetical protein
MHALIEARNLDVAASAWSCLVLVPIRQIVNGTSLVREVQFLVFTAIIYSSTFLARGECSRFKELER